jgi:hypothetical protein
MPYSYRYFIILYYSMLVTLMPWKFFHGPNGRERGGGVRVSLLLFLYSLVKTVHFEMVLKSRYKQV